MDQNEINKSDHDILNTLVANVGFLKEGQDKFHSEMRRSFDDLKNNYSGRLDRNEVRIKSLEDWKIVQIQTMKDNKNYINFLIGLGILLLGLLIWYITGYNL